MLAISVGYASHKSPLTPATRPPAHQHLQHPGPTPLTPLSTLLPIHSFMPSSCSCPEHLSPPTQSRGAPAPLIMHVSSLQANLPAPPCCPLQGYLAYAAVYTGLEVLAVPAIPLTMTAGVIFGPVTGTLIVSVSATAAATIAFLIARYAARDKVRAGCTASSTCYSPLRKPRHQPVSTDACHTQPAALRCHDATACSWMLPGTNPLCSCPAASCTLCVQQLLLPSDMLLPCCCPL